MDAQSALQALKLFNEKAEKLERLSFTQKIFSERSGVRIHWKQGQGFRSELLGPDEESREALLLTLRFFVQDNEKSSFRNMAEAYDVLSINASLSREFHEVRKEINGFLDSKTWLRVKDHDIAYREIFEVFLYGYYAHSSKKEQFEAWASVPVLSGLAENEFIYTLAGLLRGIFFIRDLNRRAIEELSGGQTAHSPY